MEDEEDGVGESLGLFAAGGLSLRWSTRETGGDAEGVISGGRGGGSFSAGREIYVLMAWKAGSLQQPPAVVQVEFQNGNRFVAPQTHVTQTPSVASRRVA